MVTEVYDTLWTLRDMKDERLLGIFPGWHRIVDESENELVPLVQVMSAVMNEAGLDLAIYSSWASGDAVIRVSRGSPSGIWYIRTSYDSSIIDMKRTYYLERTSRIMRDTDD